MQKSIVRSVFVRVLSSIDPVGCVISGFRREADNYRALLAYDAAGYCNFLPTFLDNLSVPSSRVKNPLKVGPLGCPETSTNYRYLLRNVSEARSSLLTRRLCCLMNSGDCYSAWWLTTGFMSLSILTGIAKRLYASGDLWWRMTDPNE